jgi:hypothetical protein
MLVPDNVERSNRVHHLNLDEVLETMSPKGIQKILLFVFMTVFSFYFFTRYSVQCFSNQNKCSRKKMNIKQELL